MRSHVREFKIFTLVSTFFLFASNPNSAASAVDWRSEVSRAILEGRCEDAKRTAVEAGNLDVAEQAIRLCSPSATGGKQDASMTGAKKSENSGAISVAKDNLPVPVGSERKDSRSGLSGSTPSELLSPRSPRSPQSCEVVVWISDKIENFEGGTAALVGAPLALLVGQEKQEYVRGLFLKEMQPEFIKSEFLNSSMHSNSADVIDIKVFFQIQTEFYNRNSSNKFLGSTNNCYAEYYVDSLTFNQNPLFGTLFSGRVGVRDFRSGALIRKSQRFQVKLADRFPPKEDEMSNNSVSAMRSGFRESVVRIISSQLKNPEKF